MMEINISLEFNNLIITRKLIPFIESTVIFDLR